MPASRTAAFAMRSALRPMLIRDDTQLLLPGMGGLMSHHLVNFKNRSWSLTAQIEIPDGGANGVVLTIGGKGGGVAVYLNDGVPTFCYNLFGIDSTYVRASEPVPAGDRQLRMEFAYDGGGLGKGGDVRLYVDGDEVAAGRVERTQPIGFGYQFTDVGREVAPIVTDEYGDDNAFTGTIKWLELSTGDDDHNHLIDPKDHVRVAMARQ